MAVSGPQTLARQESIRQVKAVYYFASAADEFPVGRHAALLYDASMDDDRVLGFLKFGSRDHIEQFVQGTLYMNTLDYFAEMEEKEVGDPRCDSFEGVGRTIPADGAVLSVKIGEEFQPVAHLTGAIKWRPTEGIKANVFCMYALRPPDTSVFVDERNFRFGDTFAVLIDGEEFLRRVRTAAESCGHTLFYRLVEYFDEETYTGPVGIFRKRSAFRYQSEFRIALVPGVNAPYPFGVGDLSDITQIGPLPELNRRLRFATSVP